MVCLQSYTGFRIATVLLVKSDSGVMFCLQSCMYQRHIIDRLIVYLSYPQDSINTKVIYRFALTQVECTSYFLFSDCKQNITSLSVLAGRTVDYICINPIHRIGIKRK